MTPEEFERIKEAEKAHLRKMKELKQAVRALDRKRSIGRVLSDMATGSRDLLDDNQNMIDELALETAQSEARLEMALSDLENEEAPIVDEKTRAQIIVEEIRAEAKKETNEATTAAPERIDSSGEKKPVKERTDPLPGEKTFPEKTIGRMR